MYYVTASLILLFLVLYVIPNVIRYPWHTLVFVGAAAGLGLLAGGGSRLMARLSASQHPAARRFVSGCDGLSAIVNGVPPYNAARWWIVRSLVQVIYWAVLLVMALAVLAALGGVFMWIDKQ